MEANKPYLVKTTAALLFKENVGGEVALATAAVKGSTVATGVANVAQQGTYQSETLTSNATTTYFGYQNGQVVKANSATLGPYRSSFALTTAAGTRSAYALQIGTVTTGIERLNANSITDAPAYDLQGRRVNQLAKGAVYIINGQKVIIK